MMANTIDQLTFPNTVNVGISDHVMIESSYNFLGGCNVYPGYMQQLSFSGNLSSGTSKRSLFLQLWSSAHFLPFVWNPELLVCSSVLPMSILTTNVDRFLDFMIPLGRLSYAFLFN